MEPLTFVPHNHFMAPCRYSEGLNKCERGDELLVYLRNNFDTKRRLGNHLIIKNDCTRRI